jgi:hypothetical protein
LSFTVHQYPATVGDCPAASGIGVGDVTGDGMDDVMMSICGNTPDAYVNVLPQTMNGLGTPTAYASYDIPRPVAVADMNGDNLGDVVTMHSSWMRAGVYLQNAGTLGTESLYPTWHGEYNAEGLAIGDINGDAKPDIVAANYPYGLEVLRQQ